MTGSSREHSYSPRDYPSNGITTTITHQIKDWTTQDPNLSLVRDFVLRGWKETDDPAIQPYRQRSNELSTHHGCSLWGNRVIIPAAG